VVISSRFCVFLFRHEMARLQPRERPSHHPSLIMNAG
jgi:hypothetical protein